ncbi:MAG: zf-HC2 domain-containing protein [Candidatus Binatia bacterium]
MTLRWRCRGLRAALVDAAMGTLPLADRTRVDAHLARCAPCRDELAALCRVAAGLDAPAQPTPDEDFWRRQRQSIMRRVRTTPVSPLVAPRWPTLRVAGAVATVMLALLVTRRVLLPVAPPVPHTIDHLDDAALFHLHDLLPAITPATAIDDADGDLLSVHDLGDEELDRLAEMLGDSS